MRFVLQFDMDNDAFIGENGHTEHAESLRVLHNLIARLPTYARPGQSWKVMDSNGNTIGEARVEE